MCVDGAAMAMASTIWLSVPSPSSLWSADLEVTPGSRGLHSLFFQLNLSRV